jgi:hypothetical protein
VESGVELENFKWGAIIKTTRLKSKYCIFGGAKCITIMKILKIEGPKVKYFKTLRAPCSPQSIP